MSITRTLTTSPSTSSPPPSRSDQPVRSEKGRRRRGNVFLYVALSLFGIMFLFPLVFMFVSSLKPDSQILQDIDSPMAFLPVGDISLDNYFGVFDRVPVAQFLFNSVLVTVLTVGLLAALVAWLLGGNPYGSPWLMLTLAVIAAGTVLTISLRLYRLSRALRG